MLLIALCWFYNPSLLPLFVYLIFEFVVKLISIYNQHFNILNAEIVPEELGGKLDDATFHRARSYSLAVNKLTCLHVITEQIWKWLQIGLGNVLFAFAIEGLHTELESSKEALGLHYLTLELIPVTLAFTLIKRTIFFCERALRIFCIDNELNRQTGDDFFHGYFVNVVSSMLKNAFMVSTFCEISSIVHDYIGFKWPSMCIAYWIVYIGIKCSFEYIMERNITMPNEKLTPITEIRGLLPKFILMAAKNMEFPENRIFVSDASIRTTNQNICLRGLAFPKLVIDDHLLENYEQVFNPPVAEFDNQTVATERNNKNDRNYMEINDGSEILALVTVQLARWKFNDAWTIEIFDKLFALLTFGVISLMMVENSISTLLKFSGMEKPTVVALFVITYMLFEWGKQHLKNEIKRAQELAADSYAVKAGYSEDLKSALIGMCKNNLEFPAMTKMYEATVGENSLLTRLKAIDVEASTCSNEDASKLFIHSVIN